MKQRIRVVIADDHALVRAGFSLILQSQDDFSVVAETCDAAETLATVARLHPDIVCLDTSMPDLDGIEAARRIRSLPDASPRILMTTSSADRDLDESAARAAGVDGFVRKYDTPEDIVAKVRSVVAAGPLAEEHRQ